MALLSDATCFISALLSINIASVSTNSIHVDLSPIPSVCLSVCRLVGRSVGLIVCVRIVYCGKTADWIWMPLGMVSGIGREMGVLDEVVIVEREWAVLR